MCYLPYDYESAPEILNKLFEPSELVLEQAGTTSCIRPVFTVLLSLKRGVLKTSILNKFLNKLTPLSGPFSRDFRGINLKNFLFKSMRGFFSTRARAVVRRKRNSRRHAVYSTARGKVLPNRATWSVRIEGIERTL